MRLDVLSLRNSREIVGAVEEIEAGEVGLKYIRFILVHILRLHYSCFLIGPPMENDYRGGGGGGGGNWMDNDYSQDYGGGGGGYQSFGGPGGGGGGPMRKGPGGFGNRSGPYNGKICSID